MQYYPGKPYQLPKQRAALHREFWPPRKAAREWGVSYRDALRYMLQHPEWCAWVRVVRADRRVVWILCVNLDQYRWAEA